MTVLTLFVHYLWVVLVFWFFGWAWLDLYDLYHGSHKTNYQFWQQEVNTGICGITYPLIPRKVHRHQTMGWLRRGTQTCNYLSQSNERGNRGNGDEWRARGQREGEQRLVLRDLAVLTPLIHWKKTKTMTFHRDRFPLVVFCLIKN